MSNHDAPDAEARGASTRARGVLLINLGTPDAPDVPAVRRYLAEFLSDPAVIRLPKPLDRLGGLLGSTIARFRAPTTTEMYRRVWSDSGSPLMSITNDQAAALEAALPRGWKVYVAMRYGRPGIVETLRRIEAAGLEELVVLPMYPQYSGPTTGTALRLVYEYLKEAKSQLHVTTRTAWFDDHGYINAQTRLVQDYAAAHGLGPENAYLLFSTHGLPVSYVRRGDPYVEHINRTVALVRDRLGWPSGRVALAFQSRFGPVAWLQPFTDDTLNDLIAAGEKRILICPISFTADCLETLEEIDVRYRELAERGGAELYLCPALNTYQPFISALKHLVLRGPRPISRVVPEVRTFQPPDRAAETSTAPLDCLVMVGVSSAGRLERKHGPVLADTAPDVLRAVKRSQCDVPPLLQRLRDGAGVREAWLWNTCHRYELFAWLPEIHGATAREDAVGRIRHELFGKDEPAGLQVNVLRGADAWHHLLRTAAGLNSHLPGERDILEQMQAAHRLAIAAGTHGPLSQRLLSDVASIEQSLRDEAGWNRFDVDYAYAALSRLLPGALRDGETCRTVVVGGSTTSAAVLRTLTERFDVPSRCCTLLYRGHKHGGQMKLLRAAIGNGRRVRVSSYDEPRVAEVIRDADVVFFGLDRNEPVLTAEHLQHRSGGEQGSSLLERGQTLRERGRTARPLTIFDFNLFGSTAGLVGLPGVILHDAATLEREAAATADEMCSSPEFAGTMETVERRIAELVAAKRKHAGTGGGVTKSGDTKMSRAPERAVIRAHAIGTILAADRARAAAELESVAVKAGSES